MTMPFGTINLGLDFTEAEKYESVDTLERDLKRFGAGRIVTGTSYMVVVWPEHVRRGEETFAIRRTRKGKRDMIVGMRGETFLDRAQAIIFAVYDAKKELDLLP